MQQALNAVIYARYSSHSQQEQSIEGQLRDCYAFAEREGLHVVGEYIDRAISGKTDERPDFQRMINDASKRQFQRVIVWKLDRFARNRYDSAIYKAKLKKSGVKVVSATEGISDAPEGIILEGLLESMAEYYSANLSKHVRRGQRESIINGTYLGGVPPIGYKVENKRLVIDERTAPTIRYMFEQYAKGVSKREIIAELNARGVRNKKGKPLTLSSMQAALRNEKYIGIYRYNGQEVTGGCDALIDEATFRKVQERLDKVKHAPAASKAKIDYLLQGKAFCGYCGTRMVGESGRGKMGNTYHYYACGKRKKEHTCAKKNEKKDFIEWYVVEQTVEYVLTPDRMDYIAAALVAQYEKDFGDNRITDYEKQLERVNAEIRSLVDTLAVCPPSARQPIFDKMELLDVQKTDLEIDVAKLRVAARVRPNEEQIKAWLKQFCKGDLDDMEFRERIIDVFINSVYLYDDKTIIYYNIEGGKQVSYMEMLDSTEEPPFADDPQASSGVRISNDTPRQKQKETPYPKGGFLLFLFGGDKMILIIILTGVAFRRIGADMRKKSIYWAGMVLGLFSLFILAGCGKESSQEQAAIEFQQRDGEEPFHSAVTVIDFGAEWNQPDNWLHCEPLDENNWLLWQRRGDWENGEREDAPNVETLLCLYDSKENQVKKTLVLPGYHYVDVKEDKIILTENREVYWMDRELAYTSERTPLPGFLFERMDKDGKEYGYAEYDISSDLQWIVYACRVRGLNLYHMETGETKLLRGAEEYPFWYEEDFDWWRSPMGLGFLPGDKEFMLLSDGFSVYDLEGKEIFQAAAGTVADIWGYYWHTHSGEPLLCFYEDYKSQPYRLLAEQVDVGNKQVGERRVVPGALTGENFPENGAGVVYNQNYFAWVISCSSTNGEESGNSGRKIVVYDVATLTPTVVLESSYGYFDLRGIDGEGRVFFSWQPFGGDPEEPAVINGITAPVTQKQ